MFYHPWYRINMHRLLIGITIGYIVHWKMDKALMSMYSKYPTAGQLIVGISVGMGIYFFTQELPKLVKKLPNYI